MSTNLTSEEEAGKRRKEGEISMNGLMPAAAFSESVSRSSGAVAAAAMQCYAETVGCDVWQKERERKKDRKKQGYKNKDCSSGSASLCEVMCGLKTNKISEAE
ncbi:unnamed protein product [Sphenostylis stenocarpa]|uniref:Uncharacterized protein n=1 Tax=Sphenostylis stenocarpa TaxID=92480 RepID=A0AA86VG45_9FABA|nr:unnamed protein product [Sphenostylis stenocarpa]